MRQRQKVQEMLPDMSFLQRRSCLSGFGVIAADADLLGDVEARQGTQLRDKNQRNVGYFEQEV